MSELFERLASAPIQTVGTGDVPRIDMAAGREAARTSEAMSRAMDRISSFAFKEVERRNTLQGSMLGASDPTRTLTQLQGQDPASFNAGEAAAYNAAVKGLSAEIEVEAKREMGKQYLEAVEAGEDPAQLAERLDMVTLGFSDALGMMDPAAAQQVSLTLDSYRNAQFLNYSEDHIKKKKQENRAQGAMNLETMTESLENMARSGMSDAVINKDIDQGVEAIGAMLRAQGYNEEEVADAMIRANRKAQIARVRGGFDRLETPEERLEYADRLEADIGKQGGLARGISDDNAQTLVRNFRTAANSDIAALNSEIANLKADLTYEVSTVVSAGGIPSTAVIDKMRARIDALEDAGADKARLAEVKERLATAESHIEYFRGIQGFNLKELRQERDTITNRMGTEEAGTPEDVLRLKIVKSRLAAMASDERSDNAAWKATATSIGKSVDALEKVAKRFDPIRDEDVAAINDGINKLEAEGAPEDMVAALRSDVTRLTAMSELFNDIANDSTMTLEDKINTLRQRDGGYSADESEFLALMEQRLTAMETGLKDDPLSWANGSGVVALGVDLVETVLSPDSQATDIATAVEARVKDANKVSAHYGTPKTILTKSEATALATALEEMPIELQTVTLNKLSTAFGQDALVVLGQISKDAPELAHIGGMMVLGADEATIDAAMRGRLIKAGKEDRALGEMTDMRDQRVTLFDGLSTSGQMIKTMDRLKSVADLIYLGKGGSAGGVFDRDLYNEALQLAAGRQVINGEERGGIVTYNGRNIIIPSSIKADDGVDEIFDNMESVNDLIALAVTQGPDGQMKPYDELPVGVLNQQAVPLTVVQRANLISVGDGLYKMAYKGEVLFARNGQPYLIDLKRAQP